MIQKKKEIHWLWNATIIILTIITVASVFLSFFSIDPEANEKYNDPRIQFNFQLLQFLLLIWMLSVVIIVYREFFYTPRSARRNMGTSLPYKDCSGCNKNTLPASRFQSRILHMS